MIVGITAVGRNLEIGRAGKIPWKHPEDLKFFKRVTEGNTVIMGRKTWESIGRPLPNRLNVILSRTYPIGQLAPYSDAKFKDVFVVKSVEDVVRMSRSLKKTDAYVIGGSEIYRQFLSYIDEWVVTRIPETIEDADTFMPSDFLDGFVLGDEVDLGDELVVQTYARTDKA